MTTIISANNENKAVFTSEMVKIDVASAGTIYKYIDNGLEKHVCGNWVKGLFVAQYWIKP